MPLASGYCRHTLHQAADRGRAAQSSPIDRLFVRLTGLALKMEQYRLGESFINGVVEKRGIKVANLIWEGPDKLPTLYEPHNPRQMVDIDRVAPD